MAKAGARERKTETERERSRRASLRHLQDLKRAHGKPPADVRVKSTSTPKWISPTPASSSCTSPGALCAELMS